MCTGTEIASIRPTKLLRERGGGGTTLCTVNSNGSYGREVCNEYSVMYDSKIPIDHLWQHEL